MNWFKKLFSSNPRETKPKVEGGASPLGNSPRSSSNPRETKPKVEGAPDDDLARLKRTPWFVLEHGKKKEGPFTLEQLRARLQGVSARSQLRIRKGTTGEWCAWVNVRKVFPELVAEGLVEASASPESTTMPVTQPPRPKPTAPEPPKVAPPEPPKPALPLVAKIRVPKPSKIYVAGCMFTPERDDMIFGIRGFFHLHNNLERHLPPEVDIVGFPSLGLDTVQFCDVALYAIFADGKHPGAYYLDAVLPAPNSGKHMMVVMLWEGDEATVARQQIPGGRNKETT